MPAYSVFGADGTVYGPVDDAGLVQWAREGRIVATTNLRLEPGGQIVQASALPLLAGVLSPAAGYAAPPVSPAMPAYAQVIPRDSPYAILHTLTEFSVGAVILLHFVTFGIFPFIWFGLMQDKMPRLRHDDPSAGKHIGFMFIPFFNLYWMFFAYLRLCDRIAEQRQLRGMDPASLKGLAIGACVVMLIPYVNFLVGIVLWPIFIGMLQSRVNELVDVTRQQAAQQQVQAVPVAFGQDL